MTDAVEAAREELFGKLSFDDHSSSCPDNYERVRNFGPCNCGADYEANKLLNDYEAAIRADERAQVQGDRDELQELFDLQHRREIEAIQRWRAEDPAARDLIMPDYGRLLDWLWAKVRPESALRAAAREVVEWHERVYGPCETGCECSIVLIKAALDGAPHEPSEAEVERAQAALMEHWLYRTPAANTPEDRDNWDGAARAALKAAWGGGGND